VHITFLHQFLEQFGCIVPAILDGRWQAKMIGATVVSF